MVGSYTGYIRWWVSRDLLLCLILLVYIPELYMHGYAVSWARRSQLFPDFNGISKQMVVCVWVHLNLSIHTKNVPKRVACCYEWLAIRPYYSPFGQKIFSCHTSISRVSLVVNLQNSNCIVQVGKFHCIIYNTNLISNGSGIFVVCCVVGLKPTGQYMPCWPAVRAIMPWGL